MIMNSHIKVWVISIASLQSLSWPLLSLTPSLFRFFCILFSITRNQAQNVVCSVPKAVKREVKLDVHVFAAGAWGVASIFIISMELPLLPGGRAWGMWWSRGSAGIPSEDADTTVVDAASSEKNGVDDRRRTAGRGHSRHSLKSRLIWNQYTAVDFYDKAQINPLSWTWGWTNLQYWEGKSGKVWSSWNWFYHCLLKNHWLSLY